MGVIVFNGVSSADYGIVVEHFPDTSMPQRDYGKTHVTGRNGDIVTYAYNSYGNVERNYDVAVADKNIDFGNSQTGFPISAMQGLDIAGWKTAMIRSITEWQCSTSPGISRIF